MREMEGDGNKVSLICQATRNRDVSAPGKYRKQGPTYLKHLLLFSRCHLSSPILSSVLPIKLKYLIWEFWKVLHDVPILNLE